MDECNDEIDMESQNMDHQDFFQSQQWRSFQDAFGRKTHVIEHDGFCASIIEHHLPIVGKYFYVPRGPKLEISNEFINQNEKNSDIFKIQNSKFKINFSELMKLAKENGVGWVRIEPRDSRLLDTVSSNYRVVKSPYDVQPKEIFVVDIFKSEEQLLAEMKSKTRYNIKLAHKHGVKIVKSDKEQDIGKTHIKKFLELTKEMAARQGIVSHPDTYYEKMFETFPAEMLKLYVAEYNGKIISANLMLFFGNTATYLHGASSDCDRNVMAPFLLHWQAMQDAKERGFKYYDFGGIRTQDTRYKIQDTNKWGGITKFKLGFSTVTEPVVFPGTYDIIVNPRQYALYKGLQRAKMIVKKFKR